MNSFRASNQQPNNWVFHRFKWSKTFSWMSMASVKCMRVGRLKAISYIDGQSKRILIVVIHPVCVCVYGNARSGKEIEKLRDEANEKTGEYEKTE